MLAIGSKQGGHAFIFFHLTGHTSNEFFGSSSQ